MIGAIGLQDYDDLCDRIVSVVREATPAGAVVAVISKGDPRLLELDDRRGLHFPGDAEGGYAGYYPRTSEEAIAQVETARRAGAEFLCVPATALWWLEHYRAMASWLGVHCRVTSRDEATCVIYDLVHPPTGGTAERSDGPGRQLATLLDSLLPEDALLFVIGFEPEGLAAPGRTVSPLKRSSGLTLQRRLESRPDRPTFLLLEPDQAGASAEGSPLGAIVEKSTDLVARRSDLCELRQVRTARRRSRLRRPPVSGGKPPATTVEIDGEAADKLSKRLERLGLPGQDGALPLPTGEVSD
jgi:hypothetical protein